MFSKNTLQKLSENNSWIGWVFFLDLINGMSLTLSYFFSKTVTLQYPDKEKWVPYPRNRGHHFLRKNTDGSNKCVACELCAKICPCQCIKVVPCEDEKGERRPLVFDVDTSRCLFCGLCEDACPVEAIALGQHFEFSSYTRQGLMANKETLLTIPGKTETGGYVVKAQLKTGAGVRVEAQEETGHHWWDRIRRRRHDADAG